MKRKNIGGNYFGVMSPDNSRDSFYIPREKNISNSIDDVEYTDIDEAKSNVKKIIGSKKVDNPLDKKRGKIIGGQRFLGW